MPIISISAVKQMRNNNRKETKKIRKNKVYIMKKV